MTRATSIPAVSACLLFIVALAIVTPSESSRMCRVVTHRVTAVSRLFSLVCRCGKRQELVGRSVRLIDPKVPDTKQQDRLTVECIEHAKESLLHDCLRDPREYDRNAAATLKRCMSLRPKKGNKTNPFTYHSRQCETEFRQLDVPNAREALLVCACTQRPGYIVHPGVVIFRLEDSPLGASKEQDFVRECTRSFLPQLTEACAGAPERFDVRSAQALNVCCKRARVKFQNQKLECQTLVPDDLSTLMLPEF